MVVWSQFAKDDLKSIHGYIAHDSHFYAHNVVNTIIEKTESLENFPHMGRIVPEINDENIREVFIYSYRIIYEKTKNDILIHAVMHGKRDFYKALNLDT